MQKKSLVLYLTLLWSSSTPGIVETGAFSANITNEVFDPATGLLYLGLDSGASDNAISRVARYNGSGTPQAIAIGSATSISNQSIEFLALAAAYGEPAMHLSTAVKSTYTGEQKKVIALTTDGTTSNETSSELNDAAGNTTEGIIALAANSSNIFAAVRAQSGDFGDTYSGIALMSLNQNTTAITIKNAQTGATGNKAQQLDKTSSEIKIGASSVTFLETTTVLLYWDGELERLYTGVNVKSGGTGARSVVVGYVDGSGILQLNPVAPDGAFADNAVNIVGTTNAAYEVHNQNIRVMHASTGPSYLIVNGDVNPTELHNIYALPLIDNPASLTTPGTLARKDSALTNYKFTVPATANAHLVTNSDTAALIGGGPLPISSGNIPSDIVVVGDAIYASIAQAQTTTTESGIFYSQALFDENGKIIRWTPWTKRAYPYDGFPSETTTGDESRVAFFEVDGVNGKLWAISASNPKILATSAWSLDSNSSTSLTSEINSILTAGSFSVLDLDQSTRGLGTSSPARYALFGGFEKVIFARVSQSRSAGAPYDYSGTTPYPQTVTTNFSSGANFQLTTLPIGAGAVEALEYSRRVNASTSQNFFFAGTQNGLYVFSTSGGGFTIDNSVDALNAAPFSTGTWQKMNGIDGGVVALKTSGNGDDGNLNGALYVLTLQITKDPANPWISRIYSIPYATTVTTMEANINLIAQSEVLATGSDLTNAKTILGMEIISVGGTTTKEQLVIATNYGLFRSHTDSSGGNKGVLDATDQSQALWQPIAAGKTAAYYNIFGVDNSLIKTKAWPIEIADKNGCQIFQNSSVRQMNGTDTDNSFTFVPNPFNAIDTDPSFYVLPQTTYFWSDGGRRFFIIKRKSDPSTRNRLMVLPYNTIRWNLDNPYGYIMDYVIDNIKAFFWVTQIGATGMLMAGTRTGVVSLQ